MSENRQLAKRWFEEMWNQRNAVVIDEMLHPDACGHMQGVDVTLDGVAEPDGGILLLA